MEKRVGYARSASANQRVESQVQALKAAGCSEVFSDIGTSGVMLKRPGLASALLAVKAGDQLVVLDVNRLSRSPRELFSIVDTLMSQRVELEALGRPEEAKAIQMLVNYPSTLVAKHGFLRTALFRLNLGLAKFVRQISRHLST